jgi:hypothetical protein
VSTDYCWWKLGNERLRLFWLRLSAFHQLYLLPTFGCTEPASGMWAALARFPAMADTKRFPSLLIACACVGHGPPFGFCAPGSLHI